jgi:hypothetical protein
LQKVCKSLKNVSLQISRFAKLIGGLPTFDVHWYHLTAWPLAGRQAIWSSPYFFVPYISHSAGGWGGGSMEGEGLILGLVSWATVKWAEPFQIVVRVSKSIFGLDEMNKPGKSIFSDTRRYSRYACFMLVFVLIFV